MAGLVLPNNGLDFGNGSWWVEVVSSCHWSLTHPLRFLALLWVLLLCLFLPLCAGKSSAWFRV